MCAAPVEQRAPAVPVAVWPQPNGRSDRGLPLGAAGQQPDAVGFYRDRGNRGCVHPDERDMVFPADGEDLCRRGIDGYERRTVLGAGEGTVD